MLAYSQHVHMYTSYMSGECFHMSFASAQPLISMWIKNIQI